MSFITSVDDTKLGLIKSRCYWSSVSLAVMLLDMKTRNVIGTFRSVYCHKLSFIGRN